MRRRHTLLSLIVGAILATGVAVSVALATDEPFVYDSVIGETVPADLDEGLRDAIGNPDAPTGDGGEIVPATPVETPDPYPAGLSTVDGDGDTPPPFSSDVLDPTNAYSVGDAAGARIVYAGADGGNANNGMIFDTKHSYADGESDENVATSTGVGALTITGFSSTQLFLSSATGSSFTYDLTTGALAPYGPCVGPRPERPSSERPCR